MKLGMLDSIRPAGKFIVFEGPDFIGKTTQSKLLASRLESLGMSTSWTRESGGTEVGRQLRKIILDYKSRDGNPASHTAQLLMFLADRAEHVETKIITEIMSGFNVVSDRYYFSTYAYQTFGLIHHPAREHYENIILEHMKALDAQIRPDIVIYLTDDIEVLMERAAGKERDSFEHNKDLLKHAHEKYEEIFIGNSLENYYIYPKRILKVNCNRKSVEEIQAEIQERLFKSGIFDEKKNDRLHKL